MTTNGNAWRHPRAPVCLEPCATPTKVSKDEGRAGGCMVSGVVRRGWGSGEAFPKERERRRTPCGAWPRHRMALESREDHAFKLRKPSRKALLRRDATLADPKIPTH